MRRFRPSLILLASVLALSLSACGSEDTYAQDSKAAAIAPQAQPVPVGVYVGGGKVKRLRTFEKRLGRKVNYISDYLDKRSWRTMNSVHWLARAWRKRFYKNIVITVPMLPDNGKGTMAQGAAGQLNKHFRKLARNLRRFKLARAVIRPAPEFNGNWFRWSIGFRNGGRVYAQFFRNIVTTMRSVKGTHFKFDWSPNGGSSYRRGGGQLRAATAYPGDAYVDYIGLDVFDQAWGADQRSAKRRWRTYVTMKDGLAWHARFAEKHNKPMTFPEWGLATRHDGHGGGDNPYWIRKMFEWMQTHRTAYHVYFESGDPGGNYAVFSGSFPRAAQSFVQYFGSGAWASAAKLARG